MAGKYTLVIGNKITTTVKGFYKDEAGVSRQFNFELDQDRIDQAQLKANATDTTEDASAFIKRITHGWRNQRLVLGEDGKPAEFSEEAMDCLMSVSGMGGYCYQAYVDQVMVRQKN